MSNILRVAVMSIVCVFAFSLTSYATRLDDIEASLGTSEDVSDIMKCESELARMAEASSGPAKAVVLCQLARARYLLGESVSFGDDERIKFLDGALKAADSAATINPKDTKPLYWRSMALLMKADVDEGISSLSMVKDALEGFKLVQDSDPGYDNAGAYRTHAKVLIEIPSWTFMNDTDEAIVMLEKAVKLAPDSLLNRLYLAQAYNKDGRRGDAYAQVKYILAAPKDTVRPKEDGEIRKEAWALAAELGKN